MGGGRLRGHLTHRCFDLNRACPLSLSSPTGSMVLPGLAMGAERDRALPRSLVWSWCSGNYCSLVHKHILAKPCCPHEPQSPQLCSGQVDFRITDYKIPNVSECGFFACPLQRFLVAEHPRNSCARWCGRYGRELWLWPLRVELCWLLPRFSQRGGVGRFQGHRSQWAVEAEASSLG